MLNYKKRHLIKTNFRPFCQTNDDIYCKHTCIVCQLNETSLYFNTFTTINIVFLIEKKNIFCRKMTDVQIEIPLSGADNPVGIKEEVKKPTDVVSDPNQSNDKTKEEPAKKVKYDGRCKKRKWQFNRRDDNVKREKVNPEDRVKKRKFLLVLGYAGANYVGMQRNPDVNTIEEELLKAMLKNNLITEDVFQQPQYVHFQRAARTDKGVSAARQCISLKLRKLYHKKPQTNFFSIDDPNYFFFQLKKSIWNR